MCLLHTMKLIQVLALFKIFFDVLGKYLMRFMYPQFMSRWTWSSFECGPPGKPWLALFLHCYILELMLLHTASGPCRFWNSTVSWQYLAVSLRAAHHRRLSCQYHSCAQKMVRPAVSFHSCYQSESYSNNFEKSKVLVRIWNVLAYLAGMMTPC